MIYDTIIIGSGPAGLTAAIYAVRYNLKTLVIGDSLGLITEAEKVENWPGERMISGIDLMDKMRGHAEDLDAEIIMDRVKEIKNNSPLFAVKTESSEFTGKSLILASGTEKRKLNIRDEEKFLGKGLSYCATCDGPFFRNKTVAVVGGGDAALMAAQILSQASKKVYIISKDKTFNAKPWWIDSIKNISNVESMMGLSVVKLIGEERIEKIQLSNAKTLDVQGIFVEIGSVPSEEFTKPLKITLDIDKSIKVNPDQSTNIKGVFAAGDITTNSNKFRQLITAAAEGAIAANSAFKFVKGA